MSAVLDALLSFMTCLVVLLTLFLTDVRCASYPSYSYTSAYSLIDLIYAISIARSGRQMVADLAGIAFDVQYTTQQDVGTNSPSVTKMPTQ